MEIFSKQRRHHRSKFYNTWKWKKIRGAQLRKHPLCKNCLKNKALTVATVCDHIHGWKNWLEFCRGPFQSLCDHTGKNCHAEKTGEDIQKMVREKKTKIDLKSV